MALEKALESSLDCKEIQPVHCKGDRSWVFFGTDDAEAEILVLWLPDLKNCLIGKDADVREKRKKKILMLGKIEDGKRRG